MILLTGGTGFLGTALIEKFLDQHPNLQIGVLVRAESELHAQAKLEEASKNLVKKIGIEKFRKSVRVFKGDLTEPKLGLNTRDLDIITSETTAVYHNAANTNLAASMKIHKPVNVGGTKRALELAKHIAEKKSDITFYYVSTAFVAGNSKRVMLPTELDCNISFKNAYEASKALAESHIRSHSEGLTTVTYRPSIIVGDSRTGFTSTFNVIYIPARILISGLLKVVPAIPNIPFDVVPVDYVARSIAMAHGENFPSGSTFYLTSGLGRESSPQEIVDLLFSTVHSFNKTAPGSGRHSLPTKPTFMNPDIINKAFASMSSVAHHMYESHAYKNFEQIVCERVPVFRQILPLVPYMISNPRFDNSATLRTFGTRIPEAPQFHQYADRIFEYCLRSNWGKLPA